MTTNDTPTACGLGIRGVSMAIDTAVWMVLFMLTAILVAIPTGQLETTASGVEATLDGPPALAAFVLWLAAGVGYHTLLESRYGKTLGKHLVAIRVVADDGSPPSLRASFVRNALRLIDWIPAFYLVGIVAVLLSDRQKRLGDRFGDTIVVRD